MKTTVKTIEKAAVVLLISAGLLCLMAEVEDDGKLLAVKVAGIVMVCVALQLVKFWGLWTKYLDEE